MSNAMRHTLLWSVVLASLTACGGGEGEGVVDGFSVATNTGSARATAAMQPGWAASTAGVDQLYGEDGRALADGAPAFAHAACSEARCEAGDSSYPLMERPMMYDDRPQMTEADATTPASEEAGSPGRYAAAGDASAWGEVARPNGVE